MFVRKKKNPSGVVSIQVITKQSGKYKLLRTIGCSSAPAEIEELYFEGLKWIKQQTCQLAMDISGEKEAYQRFISNIQQIKVSGTELLLGRLFDEIGFNKVKDDLFRHLVMARVCAPVSKLKTVDYLKKYHSLEIHEDRVYRYLDKLYNTQKELLRQISYEHTLKILGGVISIVFYDVTTLYFEIDNEDEIRKRGFSKEGKHQNPQIVLGLLVSIGGYPLSYEIFEGNKFEGHTMLGVIGTFKQKYNLRKLVIIADSGLLSQQNIDELLEEGYDFIIGARIKTEKTEIKDKILSLKLNNGENALIEKAQPLKLIISYSEKRAKRDKRNRERGLKRLEKQIKSGKLTKANINNRGYNKYLKMEGELHISIDRSKFEEDGKWDGLKGYLTNTDLSSNEIIENYGHLWRIEKAFRISKHDLKIRPIYHRLQKRIEAHIAINFVAYKIYKELERQLKEKKSDLSPEKAIDIAKTIYSIRVKVPPNNEVIEQTLLLNDEQRDLLALFDEK